MVRYTSFLLFTILTFILALSIACTVSAQNLVYNVDHEWVQVFNQPGRHYQLNL